MDTSRLLSRRRFLVLGTGSAAIVAGVLPASGLLQSAFAQEGAVRYCSTNGVRLRSGPGLSYRIVSTLSAGTRVTVIGQARPANGFEWTRVTMSVQSDILEGYVASQFVSRTVAAEPDPRFPIGSAFFVDAGRGRANLRDVPGTESCAPSSAAPGASSGAIRSRQAAFAGSTSRSKASSAISSTMS